MSDTLANVLVVEEGGAETPEGYYGALQRLINGGMAWQLQGSFGRTAMSAIEAGRCVLARQSARDAYGNRIPSRFEVKAGSKGSRKFAADKQGEAWARFICGVR